MDISRHEMTMIHYWLVVWNMNFMTFHSVGKNIIPTDELIFSRGVESTNQFMINFKIMII